MTNASPLDASEVRNLLRRAEFGSPVTFGGWFRKGLSVERRYETLAEWTTLRATLEHYAELSEKSIIVNPCNCCGEGKQ